MKKKKKKTSKLFLQLITILLIVTVILVAIENGLLDGTKKEQRIELRDECSLMLNNLIHQIKSENNCESLCKNECRTQGISFKRVEFTEKQNTCNSCICYCK